MTNDDSFVFIAGDCDIVVVDGDDNDGGGGDGNDCEANDSCIENNEKSIQGNPAGQIIGSRRHNGSDSYDDDDDDFVDRFIII
ncbi:hypothetical protein DERP_007039 [Dermatophagoides pteronyssinus]|uniref:Uncharacterized protein n=1 Tax=Dermatophagoides pteronyssinus TaxID=6956 RepID=A0ABQ8JTZ7_DERPT|nr:hypothetical protein DERP_007039 [Dermatophagoides pteronyssinus]